MQMNRTPRATRRLTVAVATLGLAAASIGTVATSGPADAAPVRAAAVGSDCPAPVALADVTPGMTGQGLTVTTGSTPKVFDVEVLGVAKDALAAGKDVIMVNATDLPGQDVISAGGGIWSGMSGSPVYVDGKLLGAAAWGFTGAPSPIFGVTPAEDMVKVLPAGATSRSAQVRSEAAVTRSARKVVTAAGQVAPSGTLRQLPLPLAVSGVGARSITRLETAIDRRGANVHAYAAGSAARVRAAAAPAARPVPGGNFAAIVSYGDVSLTGVGTTTAVCGDSALAFGHSFFQSGGTSLGASDADSVAILKDNTFGSVKLANPTQSFGTVDQDRFSAVRADLRTTPPTGTTVAATIRSLEGQSGSNRSEVVAADYTDLVSYYAALDGYLTIADRIGSGQTVTDWTIRGTRAGGRPLVVHRANRFADTFDPADYAASELASMVSILVYNEFEPVQLNSISFNATASPTFKQLRVTKVEAKVNRGAWKKVSSLVVRPGDAVAVRTTMLPYRSTDATTSVARFTIPANAKGKSGGITTIGGQTLVEEGDFSECEFDPESCGEESESLTQAVRAVAQQPRNDVLHTVLELESASGAVSTKTVTAQRLATVVGAKAIAVRVR